MTITGLIDFHLHPSPDVVDRKFTDDELAQRFSDKGYGGFVIKNHYFETASRARIVSEKYPELTVAGGVVLNNSVGGLNPVAVEKVADLGGKIVWMPTMDARSFRELHAPGTSLEGTIYLLDEHGELIRPVREVLEVVQRRDLVLSTGHVSAEEGIALIRAAAEMGIQKLVVTHADNINNEFSVEQQIECADLGAFIEHSYFMVQYGRTSIEEMAQQIRAVGPARVLIDSDFGRMDAPYPDEGMEAFIEGLLDKGIEREALELMCRHNPLELLGIQ